MSKDVETLFRFISDDNKNEINSFLTSSVNRSYSDLDENDLLSFNYQFDNSDIECLKRYSGYNFKHINNYLRGNWNYEENGNINGINTFQEDSKNIKEAIENNSLSLGNINTYRGVNLEYFRNYDVNTLEELNSLKNCFLLDKGFVSTSISKDKCFFDESNGNNIMIIYHIPEEFSDMVYLGNISYSPSQQELLINNYNLGYISDIQVESNKALITVNMIPKKVYDDYYKNVRVK